MEISSVKLGRLQTQRGYNNEVFLEHPLDSIHRAEEDWEDETLGGESAVSTWSSRVILFFYLVYFLNLKKGSETVNFDTFQIIKTGKE